MFSSLRTLPILVAAVTAALLAHASAAAVAADDPVQMALDLLSHADLEYRAVGLDVVRFGVRGDAATRRFSEVLAGLPAARQVELIGALADRGDKAALPAVSGLLAGAQDPAVRTAAILGLGALGGAAEVATAIQSLAAADPERAAAVGALRTIRGPEAAAALVAAAKAGDPDIRATLIDILAARRDRTALGDMVAAASDAEAPVRLAAMRTLAKLGGADQMAGMVKGVLAAPLGGERDEAERAVASVCRRDPHAAEIFLAEFKEAGDADREALLPALGRVGGPGAMAIVDGFIADARPETRRFGLVALTRWPDATVAPRLLDLIAKTQDAGERDTLLGGLIRIAPLPDNTLNDAQKLDLLQKAMTLCRRDEDRSRVVERANAIRTVEAFRFVTPYLDDPSLAEAACKSVVELAHHQKLRDAHKDEFAKALDKVIATTKTSELVERAERYKQGKTWERKLPGQREDPVTTAVRDIGSRRELFVDRYLIEGLEGAVLRLHHPQPQEIALSFDAPWEGDAPGYCTVLRDESRCRMYYRIGPAGGCADHDPRQLTGYAESADGIRWEKPVLALVEVDGSKDNNVIWRGGLSHNFTPFLDANPACPPAERYKAVGGTKKEWGGEGLWLLVSADGIRWRKRGSTPLAFPGNFDSQNLIFWDATAGCYRAYWRDHRQNDPRVPDGRDVRTAVSPDLTTWDEPRWLAYDPGRSGSPHRDQTDDPSGDHHQFYSGGVLPYPRAPHLILGFPQRYCDRGWLVSTGLLPDPGHRRRMADKGIGGGRPTREGTVVTDVLFMASRDGVDFHVWPEALVRPGIQRPGSWYYGGAWFTRGMLCTPAPFPGAPDEISIYIQERFAPETPGRLRRHTLRLDGFASVYAPITGGTLLTRTLRFTGSRLEINFSTSAGGSLRAELQDEAGRPIPGFTLADCDLQFGDQLDRVVSWKSCTDVGRFAGRPVRLRFELKDADLFALRFDDAEWNEGREQSASGAGFARPP
jgi:hypothetical protein